MIRDFKGVWIPKNIWLCKDLTAIEKIILVEIDSLDCGVGCRASNEYLATFCQCTERKISESISKLIKLKYVELVKFDGRIRILHSCLGRLEESSRQTNENCKAQKSFSKIYKNNIENNCSKNNDELLADAETLETLKKLLLQNNE